MQYDTPGIYETQFYKIIYNNELGNTTCYYTLDDTVLSLYKIILNMHITNFTDLHVIYYYLSIPVTIFNVSYNDGLILYNDDNYISLATIYPSVSILDSTLKRRQSQFCINSGNDGVGFTNRNLDRRDTNTNYDRKSTSTNERNSTDQTTVTDKTCTDHLQQLLANMQTSFVTNKSHSIQKPVCPKPDRHTNLLNKSKSTNGACMKQLIGKNATNNKIKFTNQVKPIDVPHTPIIEIDFGSSDNKIKPPKLKDDLEKVREIDRNNRMELDRQNERFRVFESDKRSYVKMKNDISKGLLQPCDIHPYFTMKYQIFRVLENRKAIDFNSDCNLKSEYEIFRDLYDACDDEKSVRSENVDNNKSKSEGNQQNIRQKGVYVPHNYQYMTSEKKEEYAQKFKMTRTEFENKYINQDCNSSDLIEEHLKKNSSSQNISEKDTHTISTGLSDMTDSNNLINCKENYQNTIILSDTDLSDREIRSVSPDLSDSDSEIIDVTDDESNIETPTPTPTLKLDPFFLELKKSYEGS